MNHEAEPVYRIVSSHGQPPAESAPKWGRFGLTWRLLRSSFLGSDLLLIADYNI